MEFSFTSKFLNVHFTWNVISHLTPQNAIF